MSEKNFIDTAINNLLQDKDLRGGSTNWANWMSALVSNSCKYCIEQHGKIVDVSVLKKCRGSGASELSMRICADENEVGRHGYKSGLGWCGCLAVLFW